MSIFQQYSNNEIEKGGDGTSCVGVLVNNVLMLARFDEIIGTEERANELASQMLEGKIPMLNQEEFNKTYYPQDIKL